MAISDRERSAQARRSGAQARQTQNYYRANPWSRRDGGFIVNAGIAKEAYFQSLSPTSFRSLLGTEAIANAPREQSSTASLWNRALATKGMFVTSELLGSSYIDEIRAQAGAGDPQQSAVGAPSSERYGFQFHYNPTTVQMNYSGNPDFDVTIFTSGRSAFNLLGTQSTQSTISFNIVLNRIHDMKYFFGSSNRFKAATTANDWSGKFPTTKEQEQIYKKGTMYDVEYFLRTVMQIKQPAGLRARNSFDGETADLGFLTGIPVDLHLGSGLRYWVRIDGFSLNHVIFNERMVPLFTEMSIQCSRIPDYAGDVAAATAPPEPTGVLSQTAQNIVAGVGRY